jgi:hypothetical protein
MNTTAWRRAEIPDAHGHPAARACPRTPTHMHDRALAAQR